MGYGAAVAVGGGFGGCIVGGGGGGKAGRSSGEGCRRDGSIVSLMGREEGGEVSC